MRRNIVIAAVTAAALIGGGTATALATTGDDGDDAARASSAEVTAADAIAAALRDTPGTAVSADLDDEDDHADDDGDGDRGERAAWEVDVLAGDGTWHSVRIDPASGKVLGSHKDTDEDDTAEARAALEGGSVSAAEAARAAAGKSTVTSVDLDDDGDDGPAAWEVETRADGKGEQDWRVDLKTGKVTADRSDSDDSDSDDSGADED
ncbi:PepSY domain-containing protein [Strepomyces sp. STD 3.1]|nr:PepSY domain-containing protein [Streptomyces sp. STD 3.1]